MLERKEAREKGGGGYGERYTAKYSMISETISKCIYKIKT